MAGSTEKNDLHVFRYPTSIRIAYPIAFLTWLCAPFFIFSLIGGTEYAIDFSNYYRHPIVALIFGAVWLSVVWLQYKALRTCSTVLLSRKYICSSGLLGTIKVPLEAVDEVTKRRQIINGKELITVFVKSKNRTISFTNRLKDFSRLISLLNEIFRTAHTKLFYEDFHVRPIVKNRVNSL
jgi:hypothetical protein